MSAPALILIAGCGYIGTELATQANAAGHHVLGITRTPAPHLPFPCVTADLTDPASLAALASLIGGRDLRIVHCASGGKGGGLDTYRAVYLDGLRHLLTAFPQARRVLFTSSTSVYAQIDGSLVDEDSPAAPDRGTGRILRETEATALAARGCAVRLAGIYGPGRSVLLRHYLDGTAAIDVRTAPPATPDGRWINHIHRTDAASALLHLLTVVPDAAFHGAIYNAADSTPHLQRHLYAQLTALTGHPLPPDTAPDTTRKRGWTHKQVSNARLRATSWQPRYPSWFHAFAADGLTLAAPAAPAAPAPPPPP